MTSGRAGRGGDFADALFGADGMADPVVAGPPPAVFADPLADAPVPHRAAAASGPAPLPPPEPAARVAAPSPQAMALAERQLAAERRRATRQAPPPQQPIQRAPGPMVQGGPQQPPAMRQPAAARRKPAGSQARSKGGSKGNWGCALFFILLILLGTGAGKEIVHAIVDAFSNGGH